MSVGVHLGLALFVATQITSVPALVRRPTRIDLALEPLPVALAEPEAPIEFAFPAQECVADDAASPDAPEAVPDFSYVFEREDAEPSWTSGFDGPPTVVSAAIIGSGRSSRGRASRMAGAAPKAAVAAPPVAAAPIPAPPRAAPPRAARPMLRATPLAGNEAPRYPPAARRRGWEGTVIALIRVDHTGRVLEVVIEQSSGHRILDDAVRSALAEWRYRPAQREGLATADTLRRKVRFVCP